MNSFSKVSIEKELVIKALYFILFFSIILFWSLSQPFNSCPDEAMRYVMPKYIFENGSLPNALDKSIIDSKYGFSYASNPQLPYIVSALFMKIFSIFSSNSFGLLISARFANVLFSAIYLIFVMKISKLIFKKMNTQWIFIFLASLWPQMMYVFTYVNCDGMSLMSVSIIVYCWCYIFKKGWEYKISVILGIGISIALLSYMFVYVFVLYSFILYIAFLIKGGLHSKDELLRLIKNGLIVMGIVFLLAGWHFIRNIVLYNDVFALNISKDYGSLYAIEGFSPEERKARAHEYMFSFRGNLTWIHLTVLSYIGVFGYMDIFIYPVYLLYFTIIVISVISLFLYIKKHVGLTKMLTTNRIIYLIGYLCAILIPFALSYYYSFSDFQPQGRYVLDSLLLLCIVLSFGLEKFFNWLTNINKVFGKVWLFIPIMCFCSVLYSLIKIFNFFKVI